MMNKTEFCNRRFLIIGGTTKAGTTSLYHYLKDHPQVCASSLKETRFFIDVDSLLPVKTRFDESLKGYREYFSNCLSAGEKVLMEASPDYLCSQTALHIADLLPNAKMVFVLRDPVDRLVSWFKYARQRGLLDSKLGFEEYVEYQLKHPITSITPSHYRALEEGCYSRYVKAFIEKMPGRVLLLSFDELKTSPERAMEKICDFSDIGFDFYKDYEYSIENASATVRYPKLEWVYNTLRRNVNYLILGNKRVMRLFRWINRYLKALMKANRGSGAVVVIDEATLSRLKDYYADEIAWMKNEIK